METVGASRRFFACAHKGGVERPNAGNERQSLARSVDCRPAAPFEIEHLG